MKWSWKLGRFLGIDVYVHATFLLLLGWVLVGPALAGGTLEDGVVQAGFVLALFGCVVFHEYGHALTARRYGIATRDIILLPIGGVARLERMPDDPRQELWVALAGPAVNVLIGAVLALGLLATNSFVPLTGLSVSEGSFFERLLAVNVILVLFNMIPAFPMDGGRVLRALLATRLEYVRATQLAATLGQGIALLLGLIGLFADPLLVFVALFVWIGAAQEAGMVQTRLVLHGIPVATAMLTDFRTVSAQDSLARVVELLLSGSQQEFPVVDEGRVVGIITQRGLLRALSTQGTDAPVSGAMGRDFRVVEANELLGEVSERLAGLDVHVAPVMRGGQLVGLLTMENLNEFLAIREALAARARA
jgi:Zn-dependent protease/CBS domain-containing protein